MPIKQPRYNEEDEEETLEMPRVQKIKRKDKGAKTYSVEIGKKKKSQRRPVVWS